MLKKVSNTKPTKIRSVGADRQSSFRIENRQMMRDLITDYIIHSLPSSNVSSSRRPRPRKYLPLQVSLQINGTLKNLQFSLTSILEKYVSLDKATLNREQGIEPLILDILSFIDQLQDKTVCLSVQIEGQPLPDTVLKALITKHIREKQRKALQGEYEQAKNKVYTRYKKVGFPQIGQDDLNMRHCDFLIQKNDSQQNSQLVSRSTFSVLQREEFKRKNIPVPTKSKLKQLVDVYNIFQHPEKIEAMRQEKLVGQFCKNEKQYLQARNAIKNQLSAMPPNMSNDPVQILQDWISQISLSEYLFKKKYLHKQNKNQAYKPNRHTIILQSDEQSI